MAARSSLPALLSLTWNRSKQPKQQNAVPVSVGLAEQLPVGVLHTQLDVSWQGGSPGGRFSAFSNYSAAVNELMPTGSTESSEQLPSCVEMEH